MSLLSGCPLIPNAAQEPANVRSKFRDIFHLAFPDNQDAPIRLVQGPKIGGITPLVPLYLGKPIRAVGFWGFSPSRARMAMPKATMHKNGRPLPHVGNIRFAWNVFAVQAVAGVSQLPA